MIAKFLQAANAGLTSAELKILYPLKEKILARLGKFDGYDWQYIAKPCFACDGTGDGDLYGVWDGDIFCDECGGSGYWKRFWTKLERRKIGNIVFHTPVQKFFSEPEEPHEITIDGYVNHAPVSHLKAKFSFYALALVFDPGILFQMIKREAGYGYWNLRRRFISIKREPVLDDLPF